MPESLVREMAIENARWDAGAKVFVKEDNLLTVRILLQTASDAGAWFYKDCRTPQELWDFLTDLARDEAGTLLREFQYVPYAWQPSSKRVESSPKITLDDLNLGF